MNAQWEQIPGPYGGIVYEVVKNDQYQFIGTGNGIFRSSDAGEQWINLNVEYSNPVFEIGIYHDQLIARTYAPSIFKSDDNGNSWHMLNPPDTINNNFFAINDYGIYMSSPEELWVSIDNGVTWNKSSIDTLHSFIGELQSVDSFIYTASGNAIYKSASDTDVWARIYVDSMNETIGTFHVFDSILFITGFETGTFYRSEDGGNTWTHSEDTKWSNGKASFVKAGETFIGTVRDTFYQSMDLGATWTVVNFISAIDVSEMISVGDTILAGSLGAGVVRSTDIAESFEPTSKLDDAWILQIGINGSHIWTGAWGKIWQQNKATGQWNFTSLSREVTNTLDIKTQNQNVFVLNDQHDLYTSSDLGKSWKEITPGWLNADKAYTEIIIDDSNIIVGGNKDFEYSFLSMTPDTGKSWTILKFLIDDELFYPATYARTSSGIFAAENDRMFKSSDNGLTWDELYGFYLDPQCQHCEIVQLFSSEDVVYALEMNDYYHSTRLLKSVDYDYSWEVVDFGFPGTGFHTGFTSYATVGNIILASDNYFENRGVTVSFDGGITSIPFNDDLPTLKIGEIVADDEYIYAATLRHGIWRRKIQDLHTISTHPIPVLSGFSCYPNPSNGSFILYHKTLDRGKAKLKITDVNGKIWLAQDFSLKDIFEVNAKDLPSGLYFVFINSGEKTYTSKIIIQK